MPIVKRLALVLVGVVIGIVIALASSPARAAQDPGSDRLKGVSAGKVDGGLSAYFELDTKSGGCWLVLLSSTASAGSAQIGVPQAAVAQAPGGACAK
jgi:hypothetical protein